MAAAIVNLPFLFSLVIFILCLTSLCHEIEAQNVGFSVELIHRDSPMSPVYNPSDTTPNRVRRSLLRSINRANRFKPRSLATKDDINADIIANSGEYLMNISIGTPAFEIVAMADTGSDLIWTQCKPCSQCFDQDAPLFDPSKSSTYKILSCGTSECTNCSCKFLVSYLDDSFASGDLASDTLTLPSSTGSPVAFPGTVIGCGHNNSLKFDLNVSGIIGLGGGNLSLITQLGSSIAGKFSYCLLPLSEAGNSSKMNFGTNAIVSGPEVVTTPLYSNSSIPTFYFLTLEAVSVGSNRITFAGSSLRSDNGTGNIIIDSGTTFTLVPQDFYSELESAVSSNINANRVQAEGFGLCYDGTTEFAVPNITMHFTDADVNLAPINTFVFVNETVSCFTFNSTIHSLAIYGNLQQMNLLVGYDSEQRTVSFKPTNCKNN